MSLTVYVPIGSVSEGREVQKAFPSATRYTVKRTLKVYNLEGNPKTITAEEGCSLLVNQSGSASTVRNDKLVFVTIEDDDLETQVITFI